MDRILSNEVVEQLLDVRLPKTKEFQKCSFITPDGMFYKLYEHYEAYKYLVINQLVSCIPDAEQLLSDLGYIRYSWIGYITLPDKHINDDQYKTLELVLMEMERFRDSVSIQIQSQPKFYVDYDLDDIPAILKKIKRYYQLGNLNM